MEIKGKKALVTGASNGIGKACALMLAEQGVADLVIIDVEADKLDAVAAAARKTGANVIVKTADLTDPATVIRVYEEADTETGGLDIVHNNAGIMTGEPDFPDTAMDKMIAVIQLNLLAMMVGSKVAIDRMRADGRQGVIINTSSVAAFGVMPADPAYSTSKIGILRFTECCKPLHEAFGIRVMAVCPGITDTRIVPKDAEWLQPALQAVKILEPEDIARAVKGIIEDDSLSGDQITVQNEQVG
jgi:3-oxoacyl-[acyl-carrier protein] reductase